MLSEPGKYPFSEGWIVSQRGLGALAAGWTEDALGDFDRVLRSDASEEDKRCARLYMAYALTTAGREEEAQEVLDSDDSLKADLEVFSLSEPPEVRDADISGIKQNLMTASDMIHGGDRPEDVIGYSEKALELLEESQLPDDILWANALDQVRYLLWEMERFEEAEAVCRRILAKFAHYSDWAYLESDNVIRHTRRAACNAIAYRIYRQPDATLERLKEGIAYAKKALEKSPIESDELFLNHYETLAALCLRAAAYDPEYQKNADGVLATIRSRKILEQGDGHIPEVVEALAQRDSH